MNRSAFTLLETLLVISLTATVGIAALSLTVFQARLASSARAQEDALALATETVRLLDEDLLLSVKQPTYGRFQVLVHGGLRLVTSNGLPGEAPEPREVVWRFDATTGAVVRTSTSLHGGATTSRTIGRPWRAFAIVQDQGALWLRGRIGISDDIWNLPLWTESP